MKAVFHPSTLSGRIESISSKSAVHRLLIAAALTHGCTRVHFTTLSEDIAATVRALGELGADIALTGTDGDYTATVVGVSTVPHDAIFHAGESGTTARLLLPIAAALTDRFTLTGTGSLTARPFADLCAALGPNGTVTSDTHLPITASGKLKSGLFSLRGDVSSQYISGLLFALPLLNGDSEIRLSTPLVSAGYAEMTLEVLRLSGISIQKTEHGFFVQGNQRYHFGGAYTAEGDWSNAAFWLAAGIIGGDITVAGLNLSSLQPDRDILKIFTRAFANFTVYPDKQGIRTYRSDELCGVSFDGAGIPDILPILATVLALAKGKSIIRGAGRLRLKESDRIITTVAMLQSLGADITGTEDGFIINGVEHFRGGEVDAANDHRIAMCAAIASTRALGDVTVHGAECIHKSYPTFLSDFQKLGGNCRVIDG